ncbi:MAG: DNA recombination protein RmuC [Reyranella sp.]|nr:DNA recombination protein RmuC [Reyranella sp.]
MLLAIVAAIVIPVVLGRRQSASTPSEERFVDLLRAEGDRIRQVIENETRGQRQELGTNLRDFRGETLGELKKFREEINSKLDLELNRMATEAETNREKLRETISKRLDDQAEAQAKAGRELREEVTNSVQKLQEGVLSVAAEQRATQELQFESFGKRLTDASEGLNTAMASLTKTLEEKHSNLGLAIDTKLGQTAEAAAKSSADLREEIGGIFKRLGEGLATTINQMSEHQKERLAAVDQTMLQLTQKHQEAGEALKLAVEERLSGLQQSNIDKLEEIRKTVDEQLQKTLQERLTSSFKLVSDQLEQVYRGLGEMQKLADGVGDLKRVLANVKTRGVYGEVQLGALMEQMFSPSQYITNAQVKRNSQERVEFALRLPGPETDDDVLLPIDSKFPIEDYERLREAADNTDLDAIAVAEANLEARVRLFAKDIGDKYVNPPQTTDIAILFLPTEGLYAEAIRRPGLAESLLEKHRVAIAGPTTLLAMLSAFRMALRAVAVQKRSAEVWNVLSAVKTEFGKYGAVVAKLQTQLETSLKTVDDLGTRTRVMNRRLGDVEAVTMGTIEAQKVLGVVDVPEPTSSVMPTD